MFSKKINLLVLLATFGCSEPFSVDRHDLIGPRIMGVRFVDGEYDVQIWNGVGSYHEQTPTVEWLSASNEVLCTDVRCSATEILPDTVRYVDLEGNVHEAVFELQETQVSLTPQWSSLPADSSLELAAREAADAIPFEAGLGTTAVRIAMSVHSDEEIGVSKMRWMTAGGVGTFLELTATTTDFFLADIIMDRDELIENIPLDNSHASLFGLHIDGIGHNQWTWMDVWYDDRPRLPVSNRWIEMEETLDWTDGDIIAATMSWDATKQDWVLVNPEVTTVLLPLPECVVPGTMGFDWSLLELGMCTISELDGFRISLEMP